MICNIRSTAGETVLDKFTTENLVGSPTVDGAYPVMNTALFDQANQEMTEELFSEYGIINKFFTRTGNYAVFHSSTGMLVDHLEKSPTSTPFPSILKVGEVEVSNMTLTPGTMTVQDDFAEDFKRVVPVTNFDIKFDDGATASGYIRESTVHVIGINAVRSGSGPVRGSKTYERVIKELQRKGITTLNVTIQSQDSRVALGKLVEKGILTEPRNMRGASDDLHPMSFTIAQDSIVQSPDLPPLVIPENFESKC